MKLISKYLIEIILLLLQLTPLAEIGTIIGSIYIFYKVAFSKNLDFFSLFLLLIPSIVLKENDILFQWGKNQFNETSWFKIFIPSLKNTVMLGPIAISTKLMAALAVPVRIIRFINKQKSIFITLLWSIGLFISLVGLYKAIQQNITSVGGITVGLRIVLSIGVILFPVATDAEKAYKEISLIIKWSVILFMFGLMNDHWIFITAAFPALILFSKENLFWKILSILMILILLLSGTTFTIRLIVIFSILLICIYNIKKQKSKEEYYFLNFKPLTLMFFMTFPFFMIFLIISQKIMPIAQLIGSEFFLSKLFGDRGMLWIYTLIFINHSNFFIVPAGRDIPVYDYGIIGASYWGAGAHNIFLEMGRQNGIFVSIILFIMIITVFWKTKNGLMIKNILLKNLVLSFIAIYMIYGLTGNSLIYDGVGFLYWLIFSQIIKISYIKKQNESSSFICSK